MTGLWPFDAAFLLLKNKFKIAEKRWKSGRLLRGYYVFSGRKRQDTNSYFVLLHCFDRRLEPCGSYRHRSAGASSNRWNTSLSAYKVAGKPLS